LCDQYLFVSFSFFLLVDDSGIIKKVINISFTRLAERCIFCVVGIADGSLTGNFLENCAKSSGNRFRELRRLITLTGIHLQLVPQRLTAVCVCVCVCVCTESMLVFKLDPRRTRFLSYDSVCFETLDRFPRDGRLLWSSCFIWGVLLPPSEL